MSYNEMFLSCIIYVFMCKLQVITSKNNVKGGIMQKATNLLIYLIIILGYYTAGMLFIDEFYISMLLFSFSSTILILGRKLEKQDARYNS